MSYYPAEIIAEITAEQNKVGEADGQITQEEANRGIRELKRKYFLGNPKPSSLAELAEAALLLEDAEFNVYYTKVIWPETLKTVAWYKSKHLEDIADDPSDNRNMFIQKSLDLYFKEKISNQSEALYNQLNAGIDQQIGGDPGLLYDSTSHHATGFSAANQSLSATIGRAAGEAVYNSLFTNKNQISKSTMAAALGYLGLNEELESVIPQGLERQRDTGVSATGTGSTALESLETLPKEAYEDALAQLVGKETEVTEKVARKLRQCALFLYYLKNQGVKRTTKLLNPETSGSFSKRILPMLPEASDPDAFVNMCTVPMHCQELFNEVNSKVAETMETELFWVYSDNDKLKEVKINTKQSDLALDLQKRDRKLKKDNSSDESKKSFISKMFARQNDAGSKFQLIETKITMEGQDPATSRTDLKADLTFEIDHFSGINGVCAIAEINGGDKLLAIRIKDLITLPNVQTVETDQHFQGLANQYHPDYSRIRLKMYPTWEKDLNRRSTSHLILDLTTIGHDISRDSETGKINLTINYRGYFEQSLNMPANDALASPELIKKRQERAKELYELTKDGKCTTERLRRKLAADREVDRLEAEDHLKKGKFIERLLTAGSILYEYTEDSLVPITAGTVAQTLDPRLNYIKKIDMSTGYHATQSFIDRVNTSQETKQEELLEFARNEKLCFFIGDLLELITDCLYKDGSDEHRDYVKNLKMKFIVSNIKLPYPDPRNVRHVNVNPISMPVDLGFFLDWFYETFSKKGVSSYPIGPFLRDFLERLINDVLYDTCYSFLLPDERPPELGFSFFIDNSGEDKFFKTAEHRAAFSNKSQWYLKWYNPYGDGTSAGSLMMPTNQAAPAGTSRTYCCIYQKYAGSFRTGRSATEKKLKNNLHVPTLYSGRGIKSNYLSNVTFKKTEVPYLRESKYFNNSYGLIGLLANVYDLSFKFEHQHANTYFYPGMIFNFILTDFMNLSRGFVPGTQHGTESDPHTDKTDANVMGFGGYYITTKVVYTRGKTNKNWDIQVDSSFFGTDADGTIGRKGSDNKPITEDAACIESYNESSMRVTQASLETGIEAQEFSIEAPPK